MIIVKLPECAQFVDNPVAMLPIIIARSLRTCRGSLLLRRDSQTER
jgi:hypothetical protein